MTQEQFETWDSRYFMNPQDGFAAGWSAALGSAPVRGLEDACKQALEEITVLVPGRVADPIIRVLETSIAAFRAAREGKDGGK